MVQKRYARGTLEVQGYTRGTREVRHSRGTTEVQWRYDRGALEVQERCDRGALEDMDEDDDEVDTCRRRRQVAAARFDGVFADLQRGHILVGWLLHVSCSSLSSHRLLPAPPCTFITPVWVGSGLLSFPRRAQEESEAEAEQKPPPRPTREIFEEAMAALTPELRTM